MNKKLFLILVVAVSTVYGADSDYSFKDDLDRCVKDSDKLCQGSSENAGDCELYQGLVNISTKVEASLTVEQRTTLTAFIERCKTEIFAVTTYTESEKFIFFSTYLSEFSQENVAIYSAIQYQNISTWSSIHTVEKVTIVKQQTLIQSSITLNANLDCPFFDGLIAAAEATGDANCLNDVHEMIDTELVDIVQDSSITFEEKTIQIQTVITQFYAQYTTFEAKLKFTQISGFGCFYQFFSCVKTYQQVVEAPSLCTGTFPDIPIIVYLQEQLAIYKKQDIKVALQFNQFIQRVNQSFQQITVVEERHFWYANYVRQWMVLNYNFCTQYIFPVGFGEFGNCYDFCFCDGFEGPVIVTQPPKQTTVPVELTTTVAPGMTSEIVMTTEGVTVEGSTFVPSGSTSFFTEIPSTSSSCACVCE